MPEIVAITTMKPSGTNRQILHSGKCINIEHRPFPAQDAIIPKSHPTTLDITTVNTQKTNVFLNPTIL